MANDIDAACYELDQLKGVLVRLRDEAGRSTTGSGRWLAAAVTSAVADAECHLAKALSYLDGDEAA